VYTTLAENLLKYGYTRKESLYWIKEELLRFNVEDIRDEQLIEEERRDLVVRIDNVVN
jgi:hypothetical protein